MSRPMNFRRGACLLAVILAAALLLTASLTLAGCGSTDEAVDQALDEVTEDLQQVIEDTTAHSVTVTGFTCPIPSDEDTGEAATGNIFASVNVKIKNESDNEIFVGAGNFSLEDANGTLYDAKATYNGANAIGAAETIAPGEELEGLLVFEVPEDAEPKVLVEDAIAGESIRVDLPAPS